MADGDDRLLADLLAVIAERGAPVDADALRSAFTYAREHVPMDSATSVARICAGLGLDTATLCTALLTRCAEDGAIGLEELRAEFGELIANLVAGVVRRDQMAFHP